MPRRKLTDEERKESEAKGKKRRSEYMKKRRMDPNYKEKQSEYNKTYRKRKAEKLINTVDNIPTTSTELTDAEKEELQAKRRETKLTYIKKRRMDPNYKEKESENKKIYKKRKTDESLRNSDGEIDLNDAVDDTHWQNVSDKFFKAIADGPTHRCFCCDRLWFKQSIHSLTKSLLREKGASEEFLNFVFATDTGETGEFCYTCKTKILYLQKPVVAVNNGFKFPEIPECLKNLSPLEERLVSCRLPFMQIRNLGRDRQYGIHGSVVNVEIPVDTTIDTLPRNLDDGYTIHVKLKKRMSFKSDYMYEIINPAKVFKAARYLANEELYQYLGVNVSLEWYEKFSNKEFDVEKIIKEIDDENASNSDEDEEFDINPGANHTLIGQDRGIAIAPGENQTPKSLLFDECAEELAFPTIYCGKARHIEVKHTYTQIANSEIRRFDRRAARPDHLLYAFCKFNHYRVLNATQTALRRKKNLDNNEITAQNMLNDTYISKLVTHNDAYKFLKAITNSPAHWENEKKRVFAAIRQFGLPTLFVTVSAAETHWYDLLKHLAANQQKNLTEEDFKTMTYDEKCKLIQNDPVTCALYFDHKYKHLRNTWNSKHGPFAGYKISHSYYRIEFQHRGSPHGHMIIWLEDAPKFKEENAKECEEFIEKLMTCSIDNEFVEYQRHKHSFTCRRTDKTGKEYCRFHMPFFPMDKTRLLIPFEQEEKLYTIEDYENLVEYVRTLNEEKKTMEFSTFLSNLGFDLKKYLNIIRSGINRPTVCLKRNINEIMINNYNPKIINLMQSNMDIQFIVNGYACVQYVVDYINKSQRGLSKLLKKCVEETRKGNLNLRESLRVVANQFINASEICAQEAAWSILELPMSRISEDDIFIPTFLPGERARLLKSKEKLQNMHAYSKDVFECNIFEKYMMRPDALEDLCLADFAACYEFKPKGEKNMQFKHNEDLYACKRRKPKILRFAGHRKTQNESEYYREQITLYTSWRDEDSEILNQNFKQVYTDKESLIERNRQKYTADKEFDEVLENMDEETDDEEMDESKNGEKNEHLEEIELDYDHDEMVNADIKRDMNEYYGKDFTVFKIQSRMVEREYLKLIRCTNIGQHDILKHLMYLTTMQTEPYHIFITGPAGCGKSFLITAITETLYRIFDTRGTDPSTITVLKVAPTGKAAYNIQGLTIHNAFGLPPKSKLSLPDLGGSTLNEYRSIYLNLRVLIIDEISMVGYKMFKNVDQRLRQIMGRDTELFGGLSVLCFGDFRQLPPVRDYPVYQIPKNNGNIEQLAGNILWEKFKIFDLSEIMRQKEDKHFAECLNNLANGEMSEKDISLMNSRIVSSLSDIPETAMQLFWANDDVDSYNTSKIEKIENVAISEALDRVSGIGSISTKSYLLRSAKKLKRADTNNLSNELKLAIGVRYMVIYNVDTTDGLVNGALGVLRHIEYCPIKKSDKIGVKRIWLEFEDKKIGKISRKNNLTYMIKNKIDKKYTPINRISQSIKSNRSNELTVTREQFPVQIAEAMTIHKSQGATYDQVAVNLRERMPRSMVYVGTSRATKASGLYLRGKFVPPAQPSEKEPLKLELERLRQNPIVPEYAFLHNRDDYCGIQFIFHNVQSLHAHFEDVKADPCFMQSDFMFLAETWSIRSDKFKFPEFEEIFRIDSHHTRRNASGVAVFGKEKVSKCIQKITKYSKNKVEIIVLYVYENVRFAVLYASPRASEEEKLDAIFHALEGDEHYKTVLVGDFNVNFDSTAGKYFAEQLTVMDLYLRTIPTHYTTKGNTSIDAIFSNKSMRTGIYQSVFSYHRPLYGRID